MKKLYMLLFIILFVTGCTLSYDVKIYDDESVSEVFRLEINNNLLGKDKKEIIVNLEKEIEEYKQHDLFKDYTFSYKIDKQSTNVIVEKDYLNLASFYESYFIKRVFVDSNFIKNKNLMSLNFKNYDDSIFYGYRTESIGELVLTDEDVKEVTFNFYFERKILEHNSVNFNEKENKYSWLYNPNQEYPNIEIVYTADKRYDIIIKNLILKNLSVFIPLLIVLITSIFLIVKIIFKIKGNKRI